MSARQVADKIYDYIKQHLNQIKAWHYNTKESNVFFFVVRLHSRQLKTRLVVLPQHDLLKVNFLPITAV